MKKKERMTREVWRAIFWGSSFVSFLLLIVLTWGTLRDLPKRDNRHQMTPEIALGKRVWEENNCVGCHTLLGEGAYFAPELGNVSIRRGEGFIQAWIAAMPTGTPGRRQMPHFNLNAEELDALAAFLKWTSKINTANWPPNIEG
ncbi:c-type cytochrome [Magnetococcales bacterium HHB-1]